jgi:Tfp pilus assembly protein PilW
MRHWDSVKPDNGVSVVELLVSMCVLIPVIGAAMGLFSVGAKQHSSEQGSISANQEIRAAFEMMTTEIAQAGSHGDRNTTLTAAVTSSASAQAVTVDSTTGFTAGDYVDVDTGTSREKAQLTAVGANTLSAPFRTAHAAGAPVRLFALPFMGGVIPPSGVGAHSTSSGSTLRFFGDINSDSTVQYVEYIYDATNRQITRSITPITQTSLNQAVAIVQNIKPNSASFTVTTDNLGIVISVGISMTVMNSVKTGSQYEETTYASKISIPGTVAASALLYENQRYGGPNCLPPTPSNVTQWTGQ